MPDTERFHQLARVVDVASDDVLWVRDGASPRAKRIDELTSAARCVPLAFFGDDAEWWKVKGAEGREGFANRRHLALQDASECRAPKPAGTISPASPATPEQR